MQHAGGRTSSESKAVASGSVRISRISEELWRHTHQKAELNNLRATSKLAKSFVDAHIFALSLSGGDLHAVQSRQPHDSFASFPNLQSLRLHDERGSFLTDSLVQAVLDSFPGALAGLAQLDLKRCSYLTGQGMRSLLGRCGALRHLATTRWVEAGTLSACGGLGRLESLDLGDGEPTPTTFSVPTAAPAHPLLLQVDILSVDDEALATLSRCQPPRLSSLGLARCVLLTDLGLLHLARLPLLSTLDIRHTSLRGVLPSTHNTASGTAGGRGAWEEGRGGGSSWVSSPWVSASSSRLGGGRGGVLGEVPGEGEGGGGWVSSLPPSLTCLDARGCASLGDVALLLAGLPVHTAPLAQAGSGCARQGWGGVRPQLPSHNLLCSQQGEAPPTSSSHPSPSANTPCPILVPTSALPCPTPGIPPLTPQGHTFRMVTPDIPAWWGPHAAGSAPTHLPSLLLPTAPSPDSCFAAGEEGVGWEGHKTGPGGWGREGPGSPTLVSSPLTSSSSESSSSPGSAGGRGRGLGGQGVGWEAGVDEGVGRLEPGLLTRLRELRLGGSSVTNAGLASLNKAAHLTALDLGAGFECTLEGLQHLAAAPTLQTLTLGNFNIRGLGLRPPPPPHAVTATRNDFQAGHTGRPGSSSSIYTEFHNGGHAAWVPAAMREEGRQPFPKLTHLKFGGAFFNRAIAAVFPLGPLLTRVTASGFDSVTDTVLTCLVRQRSLTHLELQGGYHLTPEGLTVLAQLPFLQHLSLRSCPAITPQVLQALQQRCSSLEHTFLAPSAAFEALSSSTTSCCSPLPSPYTSSPYEGLAGSSGGARLGGGAQGHLPHSVSLSTLGA
ncbi:hypothetical protein V8C86DRAFT_3132784 [Haematococcus lacustris]